VSRKRDPRGIVVAWLMSRIVTSRAVEVSVVVGMPPWLTTISPCAVSAERTATRRGQPVVAETFVETSAWPKVSFSRRVGAVVRMTVLDALEDGDTRLPLEIGYPCPTPRVVVAPAEDLRIRRENATVVGPWPERTSGPRVPRGIRKRDETGVERSCDRVARRRHRARIGVLARACTGRPRQEEGERKSNRGEPRPHDSPLPAVRPAKRVAVEQRSRAGSATLHVRWISIQASSPES
jgi:hypothetical protein